MKDNDSCVKYLLKNLYELSASQIMIMLSFIDAYSFSIMSVSKNQLQYIYSTILNDNNASAQDKLKLAYFLMPIILRVKYAVPNNIVTFSFEHVHQSLANNVLPISEWKKLNKLLPETFFDGWDKCKRLRKAMKKRGYNLKMLEKYNDDEEGKSPPEK